MSAGGGKSSVPAFLSPPKWYEAIRKQLGPDKTATEQFFPFIVWGYFFFFWVPFHIPAAALMGSFFLAITPFVLPFLLWGLAVHAWFDFWWAKKYKETEYCTLEIRLPEEITQSPYAAELMLRGIYQTGFDSPADEYWGSTFAWFSLEIVSTGGEIHFYIWSRRKYKQLIEAQVYAHYPTVQVVEVPDYTLNVPYDPAVMNVGGIEQSLQKADVYPIVTYVEIGMDKPGLKEEHKHDPLASLLEYMGSVKPEENMWVQIIIRAHHKNTYAPNAEAQLHEKLNIATWAEREVKNITEKVVDDMGRINFNALTQGDRRDIEAIQQKLNKQLYEVGIRCLYIAPHDLPGRTSANIGFASAFRSFEHGSEGRGLNGLKPVFWIGPFNYGWHDFMGIRKRMLQKRFYDAYITRQFFYPPHKHRWIVLNSEELATLYHFPGKVIHTPTLSRMPSRRSEAPANLPT